MIEIEMLEKLLKEAKQGKVYINSIEAMAHDDKWYSDKDGGCHSVFNGRITYKIETSGNE